MNSSSRKNILLLFVCILGFILRVVPLVNNWNHPNFFMEYDSWGYHQIAKNLYEGNGYSWDDSPPYEINVYRTPGFPVMLLVLYSLFGIYIPYAIFLNVIIGTGVVFLTYFVASKLLGARVALFAATLQALDPLSIAYSNYLLTEVCSSAVLIFAAYLGAQYLQNKAAKFLILLGSLLGIGTMIHPLLLFLPVFLIILPLLAPETKNLRHIAVALIAILIACIPPALWILRNAKVADYANISCVTAVNLLKYKAAGVVADIQGTNRIDEMKRLTEECEEELVPGATRGDRWRSWEQKAKSILWTHPCTYMKLHIKGMAIAFFGPAKDTITRIAYGSGKVIDPNGYVTDNSIKHAREENNNPYLDLIRYIALLIQFVTYLGFFYGLAKLAFTKKIRLLILLIFPIIYVLLLSGGPESFSRFRVLFMPFVCILSAIGLIKIVYPILKRVPVDFVRTFL